MVVIFGLRVVPLDGPAVVILVPPGDLVLPPACFFGEIVFNFCFDFLVFVLRHTLLMSVLALQCVDEVVSSEVCNDDDK